MGDYIYPTTRGDAMYEIALLMECKHINIIQVESVVHAPALFTKKVCDRCKQESRIKKMSPPSYMGDTAPNPAVRRNEKGTG